MTSRWCALLVLGFLGQTPPPAENAAGESQARLAFMKKYMESHDVRALDDRGTKFQLQVEPVLRFTNPVGGSRDGAMFLWSDETGRPAVASQLLWTPEKIWIQELSSLTTSPLIAKSADGGVWKPSKGAVSFKPVLDAPKPADAALARLRQMRDLAQGFAAEHFYRGQTWNKLRLLTTPFARYGKAGSDAQDGALYCFAHGTDPEVLLLLESRPGKSGPEWQYAFAPMTTFAVNAFWKGKEVWSLPARNDGTAWDSSNTFHQREVSVEEERLR
jgi:hypothetical protein